MPEVDFEVVSAAPISHAASPHLVFAVRITTAAADTPIHTIAMRCQIQIEATRRHYDLADQARLRDLFGDPDRWAQTLRTTLWTHATAIVPRFVGETFVDLHVPCSFDFNVAATKFFAGLDDGEAPLCFQFSGTIFYEGERGVLQVAQIPWSKEARFRLPIRVWREMMELYYPNSTWLRVPRDVFERLDDYKRRNGIPTWDQLFERLLGRVEEKIER